MSSSFDTKSVCSFVWWARTWLARKVEFSEAGKGSF